MKKKLLMSMVCLAMVSTLLAGCGNGDGGKNVSKETPAATDASTPQATKAQEEETKNETTEADLAASEASEVTEAQAGKDSDYDASGKNYAFLFKAAGNPNGEKQMEGFKKVIESYGGTAVLKAPESATVEGQITMINELIAQHVDCIAVTGNDVDALQPSLQKAMDEGIKVLSTDGQVNPASRAVHVNQADSMLVGKKLAEGVANMVDKKGQIAVLSANSESAQQNIWIGYMQDELKASYPDIELVKVVYGDDEFQKSVDETEGLIKNYPDLKAIVAPTTVGISAAGKVVTDKGFIGKIAVTGLGLPSEMAEYIKNGACPYMYLWNPDHVGALTAYTSMALVEGKITGKVGETFEGKLGEEAKTFTITESPDGGTEILMGEPFEFNSENIDDWKDIF